MATDITKPAATALSADLLGKLTKGIAESRATTVIAGGKPLMRMLKDGGWVFGQRDDAMQEGSSWALNPLSIQHGWCAWTNHEGSTKNSLVGEVMAAVYEPKPLKPGPVEGWPFAEQRLFDLKCLDGDDEGTETVYKTSSIGGMRAVDELLGMLQAHLAEDPMHPCPVIQLLSDSYQHQKYGKIYIPVFEIVGWATMNGEVVEETGAIEDNSAAEAEAAAAAEAAAKAAADAAAAAAAAAAARRPAPAATKTKAPLTRAAKAPAAPAPTSRRRPVKR